MALTVVTLPVPAGNGVGAAVDVHTLDSQKSFALDGTLGVGEQLVVEVTEDPAGAIGFTGLVYWDAGNVRNVTIPVVAAFARIRRFVPGGPPTSTPTSSVSATTTGTNTYFQLTVPASGVGAAVDVSAGGQHASFSIHDGGTGLVNGEALVVEGSNDNVSFVGIIGFTFKAPPNFLALSYKFLRIRRLAPTGTAMSFFVGTSTDSGAGGGGIIAVAAGAGISVATVAGTATVTNTGVTSAIAGTGIGVSAATGAVTFTNTGVTSIIAGAGISVNAATGAVTITNTGTSGTLATTYAAGAVAGDQTMALLDAKGGQVIFDGSGALTSANMLQLTGNGGAPNVMAWSRTKPVMGLGTLVFPLSGGYTAGVTAVSTGASAVGLEMKRLTAGANADLFDIDVYNGAVNVAELNVSGDGANDSGKYAFYAKPTGGGLAIKYVIGGDGRHQFIGVPYATWSSGGALGQANGTVMRYSMTPPPQASAVNTTLDAFLYDAVTATFTGGVGITTATGVNLITINAPTYTSAAATAISTAATLAITGPPIAAGLVVLNALAVSIWVQSGSSRFDGNVLTNKVTPVTGTLTLAGAGTLSASVTLDNAGVAQIFGGNNASSQNGTAVIYGLDNTGNALALQSFIQIDGRSTPNLVGIQFNTGGLGGNLIVGSNVAVSVNGAVGSFILGQVTTAPTGAPAKDHIHLYVDGGTGSLKCRTNTATYTLAV